MSKAKTITSQAAVQYKDIPVLHGFRALFIFLVGNFHIWQQSWMWPGFMIGDRVISLDFLARAGYVFVDGMVLISALLLFLPYARNMVCGSPLPDLKEYCVKRLARILPSYYFFILPLFFLYMYPIGRYGMNLGFAWKDILYHVFLLHTFDPKTYFSTNLGAGLWTIVILAQGYLLMPFAAKGIRKKPLLTLLSMFVLGNLYRLWVLQSPDIRSYMNQLPAFLDTYALGFLLAWFFVKLEQHALLDSLRRWQRIAFSLCLLLVIALTVLLLKFQASSEGHAMLMVNQVKTRLPFTLLFALGIVFASLSVRPIVWLFSNSLVRFLAVISYNFYIWHQVLAVELRVNLFDTDYMRASNGQQMAYTLLCWSMAILISAFAAYYVEKPANNLLRNLYQRRHKHEGPKTQQAGTSAGKLLHRAEKGRKGTH